MRPNFDEHRRHVEAIVAGVRAACDPRVLVMRRLRAMLSEGWDLSNVGSAVGKAALGMAVGLESAFHRLIGPTVVPRGSVAEKPSHLNNGDLILAGHPLPDIDSRRAGRAVARQLSPEWNCDVGVRSFTVLLSGGASSLMVDPPPEITIDDYRAVVRALLRAGADIHELNTVRRHIDLVKGGWLARRADRVPILVLALSDVVGDDLSVIGSGPFSPDPTAFGDAWDVLLARGCVDAAPSVSRWIRDGMSGLHPETPKPGDPVFGRVRAEIIGSNATAVAAARDSAGAEGFRVIESQTGVVGEASDVGRALARRATEARGKSGGLGSAESAARPDSARAILWGGESTVTVGSAGGAGGRNQELALAAAVELDGVEGVAVATFATDGVDGPTDAAGAVVTGRTVADGRKAGLDAREALSRHDSCTYLDRLGCLVRTGPTGTNVNDIAVALVY